MFQLEPEWYLFFYLTMRLGLRAGEVYAISHRQVRERRIIIDQAVQRGYKERPAIITTRKNDEAYVLDVSQDVIDAIAWHVRVGFAGEEFLFSRNGEFHAHLTKHRWPLRRVQKALGLRELGHHAIGRHSVASQAATAGTSMKAIQAQLGHRSEASTHKYAHLGSGAQLRVVESLRPSKPAHLAEAADANREAVYKASGVRLRRPSAGHVNVASTEQSSTDPSSMQELDPQSDSSCKS